MHNLSANKVHLDLPDDQVCRKDSGIEFCESTIVRKESSNESLAVISDRSKRCTECQKNLSFGSKLDIVCSKDRTNKLTCSLSTSAHSICTASADGCALCTRKHTGLVRRLLDVHQWWRSSARSHVEACDEPKVSLESVAKNSSVPLNNAKVGDGVNSDRHNTGYSIGHWLRTHFGYSRRHHVDNGLATVEVKDFTSGSQLSMKRICVNGTSSGSEYIVFLLKKEVIGKGANSTVRVVEYAPLNHKAGPLAVKEFRERLKKDSREQFMTRIHNEFSIAHSLYHPYIIQTVDFFEHANGHLYQAMEYCPNGDLCSLLQQGPLTWNEAVAFFAQLSSGVLYMHEKGVVHRDLKPENLLLDANGVLKISDFGEAEVVESEKSHCRRSCKSICGSRPYIAPEEYSALEFDGMALDIWSCGIIFLVMVYSRIPWSEATAADPNYLLYLSHQTGGFLMIDSLPGKTRRLVKAMLDPNPSCRITDDGLLNDVWLKSTIKSTDRMLKASSKPSERLLAESCRLAFEPSHIIGTCTAVKQ